MAKHITMGEGFAFFRWHCLRFPWSECRGINDPGPGVGLDGCAYLWKRGRRS